MNRFDILEGIGYIDEELIDEACEKSVRARPSRPRLALIAAAAVMAIALVSCGIYEIVAAWSEVKAEPYEYLSIHDRIESFQALTYDADYINALAAEYGIAREELVVNQYHEEIHFGYYFSQVLIASKEKAVALLITDAEQFTFDFEFNGYFIHEKTKEFKIETQSVTAKGGTLEIIMYCEDGWECIGGILARSHPEEELNMFTPIFAISDGKHSGTFLYADEYYTKLSEKAWEIYDSGKEGEVASKSQYDHNSLHDGEKKYDVKVSGLEAMIDRYAEGITYTAEKTYYVCDEGENGEFIELGYIYDDSGAMVFMNENAESTATILYATGIFYNAEKDEYRVVKQSVTTTDAAVARFHSKDGWKCIGVTAYRLVQDSFEPYGSAASVTYVENDMADSMYFAEKVWKELANNVESMERVFVSTGK